MIDDMNKPLSIKESYLQNNKITDFEGLIIKKTIIKNSIRFKLGKLNYQENNIMNISRYK